MNQETETIATQALELERHFQDEIIARKLPPWLHGTAAEHRDLVAIAIRKSLEGRQLFEAELQKILGIDSFCAPRLRHALKTRYALDVDPHTLWFQNANLKPVSSWGPNRTPIYEPDYYQEPLLEAALYNFTVDQTKAKGQPKNNGLYTETGTRLPGPSAQAFATLCRDLDLGKQYQQHLAGVLDDVAVQHPLQDMLRYTMLTDAFKAHHDGVLSHNELKLLIRLCHDGRLAELDNHTVTPKQLQVLGCDMQQIVLFDICDKPLVLPPSTQRLLAYIPGDPQGAWSASDDLAQFSTRVLKVRLRQPEYRRFFARFVPRKNQQVFFSTVISSHDGKSRMSAYDMPLFGTLVTAYKQQLKDDAATIVPPVADLDRAIQEQHDQQLQAEGMGLLYYAALFVPAINWALLAVTAWQILSEAFHAVESWRDGDTAEAWDHLTNIAKDLGSIAAVGLGAAAVKGAWNRSLLVDRLVPARLEDGSERLWNGDLAVFREAPPATATADEQGIWRQGDKAWVWMEGHHYPVTRHTDGHWQLRPVRGHGPRLLHNGAGAWRIWTEDPMEWSESRQLFRRLGQPFAELDDQQIDDVMQAQGMSADQLRALHVYRGAPDGELLDTVTRRRVAWRISKLVGTLRSNATITDVLAMQAAGYVIPNAGTLAREELAEQVWAKRRLIFDHLYQTLQGPDTAGETALRRQFSSLHHEAARTLMRGASATDRQRVLDSGRIPLRLSEAARASVTRIRLARVFEALLFDTTQNADLAQTALSLLKYLPGEATTVRWRLFEGSLEGPLLLATDGGVLEFDLVHQDGQFQLYDENAGAVGEPGELFATLIAAYHTDQLQTMEISEPFSASLQHAILDQARQRGEEVARILRRTENPSWFSPPTLQTSGRIGYPLSGRSPGGSPVRQSPRALAVRLRLIYPTLSNVQVSMWMANARGAGVNISSELSRLEREFRTFSISLRSWAEQGRSALERTNRHDLRRALQACWQRRLDVGTDPSVLNLNRQWTMLGAPTGTLPQIPEGISLEHVYVVAMRGMGLESMPERFAQAFPNLRILQLQGNLLQQVPQAFMQMRHLTRLELFNNRIILDAAQSTILASCEQLVYLDLSNNPLGRTFSLGGMTQLQDLRLASTGIDRPPHQLMDSATLRYVDLRNNLITELPEGFYESRLWNEGRVYLSGNPLSQAEADRMQEALLALLPGAEADPAADRLPLERWYDVLGDQQRRAFGAAWAAVENHENSFQFFHLLTRLMETAEFRQPTRAPLLGIRVLDMLTAMQADPALCQELFQNALQTTCQDSVALRFSDLELRVRVHRALATAASGDRQSALMRLGRQLWRLDRVDRLALQEIRARRANNRDPDGVEVLLAYRVRLRTRLDLPTLTSEMAYSLAANVSERQLRLVQQEVLSAETDEELTQFLISQEFWQQHLSTAYRPRFDASNALFHQRLETLLNDDTLSDTERDLQSQQIASQQKAAEQALRVELTRECLEAHSG